MYKNQVNVSNIYNKSMGDFKRLFDTVEIVKCNFEEKVYTRGFLVHAEEKVINGYKFGPYDIVLANSRTVEPNYVGRCYMMNTCKLVLIEKNDIRMKETLDVWLPF